MRRLLRTLRRPEILARLGIMDIQLEPISPDIIASKEKRRQTLARADALQDARREALLERLSRADRHATVMGTSIADAWDSCKGKPSRSSSKGSNRPRGRRRSAG